MLEDATEQATPGTVPQGASPPVDDRTSMPANPAASGPQKDPDAAGEKSTARLEAIRKRRAGLQEALEQVQAEEQAAITAVRKRRRQRAQRGRTVLGALVLTLVRDGRPGAEELVRAAIGQARDDADRVVVTEVLASALGVRRRV